MPGGRWVAVLVFGSARARWVLAVTTLGSGLAFLDATVVNIALPRLGESLGAGMGGLQWAVNGYTLALAALILLGGSLGDRFGRRRVFVLGVALFAAASLACGLAVTIEQLVAARVAQGVGGALLTPGSLAILQASFRVEDRAKAIGAWSGLVGVAGAAGPFLGGWLVDDVGWRWVFLINPPLAAIVIVLTVRFVPESKDPDASRSLDVAGAVTGAVGLGALTYALIAWPDRGLLSVPVVLSLALGVLGLAGFVAREHVAREPMLPLGIFGARLFSATNLVTFVVYAALGGVFLFLVLALQVVGGFSPLAAGAALLPVTVLLLLLSARVGALAARIGPRLPMSAGPALAGVAVLAMATFDGGTAYWLQIMPVTSLFGLGLALTVAPLTATVLAAAPDRHAGLASGVNNAVARVGALLAVAALPLIAGLDGQAYDDPAQLLPAYRTTMLVCAVLLLAGGALALALVRSPAPRGVRTAEPGQHHLHCAVDGPAMESCPHDGPLVTEGHDRG